MNLIVAFGNPGKAYNFTRHNFGFLALDFYAKTHNLTFQPSPKFLANLAKSGNTIFAQPQTYYNAVGESVSKLINFYKIDPATNLLVICDDFDLPFGTIRQREQGSASGNNGLKSTIEHLGNQQFHRLRLGTNQPEIRAQLGDVNFVLSKFTPEERQSLPKILTQVSQKIDNFLQ